MKKIGTYKGNEISVNTLDFNKLELLMNGIVISHMERVRENDKTVFVIDKDGLNIKGENHIEIVKMFLYEKFPIPMPKTIEMIH